MKNILLYLAAVVCVLASSSHVSAQAQIKVYLDTSDLIEKTVSPSLRVRDRRTLKRYGRDREGEFKGNNRERQAAKVMLDLQKDSTLLRASKPTGNVAPEIEALRADVFFAEYFDQLTADYLQKHSVSEADKELMRRAVEQIKSDEYLEQLNEVLAGDLGTGPDRETNAAKRVLSIRAAFNQLKPSDIKIGPKGETMLPPPLCSLFPPCPK